MLKINIITQLLVFFVLAIIINQLNLKALLAYFLFLIAILMLNKIKQFLRVIKNFKWLFLVMIGIFAFNTPGEHLVNWPFALSPTYEGIVAGFTQMLRIAIMLAALSLILAFNSRQQLISGFYFIFSPLKYLGLEVERFAARLWLTLHYVELQRETVAGQDFFSRLKNMTALKHKQTYDDISINFILPKFRHTDYIVIALLWIIVVKVFA
jgi:energy-coupling factor transporter transmembrane protein EcfT